MQKKTSESNKRISFPISLFEKDNINPVSLSSEIHVVPTGEWKHWSGQEFAISPDTIKELVRNFKEGVRKDIPITAGHDNGMSGGELPAVGWFKELVDRGVQGLYALVEWTADGNRLLRDKAFKYFSAELQFDYDDLETGTKKDCVLVGGALTNKPFFKQLDMDPVAAFSEEQKAKVTLAFSVDDIINQFNLNDKTMDLKSILAKNPTDLTPEEKTFVVEHKDELDATQKETFKDVIAPAPAPKEETPEEKTAREEKEKGDANEAAGLNRDGSTKEKIDASDKKTVTLSEVEVKLLREQADQGAKAFAELDLLKVGAEVSKFVLSEGNKSGKFLPKEKDAVTKFYSKLSADARKDFAELVKAIPTQVSFKEIGNGGSDVPKGAEEIAKKLDAIAKDNMKAFAEKNPGKTMKYSDALKQAQKDNKDLMSEYEKSGSQE